MKNFISWLKFKLHDEGGFVGIAIGAVVAAGAGMAGAAMSADASSSAADKAAGATRDASLTAAQVQNRTLDEQKAIYEATQKQWEPYRAAGEKGLSAMDKLLYGGYDMKESPSAQYALTQGNRALTRQMAARGNLGGGTAAQRLSELSSGIAASDYNNRYNQLLNAIQTGSGAVAGTGNAGTVFGNQLQSGANAQGNFATNAGNNLANIAMNQGQQTASLYGGLGGAVGNTASTALKAYQTYNNNPAIGPGYDQLSQGPNGYTYNNPAAVGPFIQ